MKQLTHINIEVILIISLSFFLLLKPLVVNSEALYHQLPPYSYGATLNAISGGVKAVSEQGHINNLASNEGRAQRFEHKQSSRVDKSNAKKQAKRREPPSGVHRYSDIEYANVDGQSLRLDLYMPENKSLTPPLIAWVHGGGWANGDKGMVNPAVMALSGKGYAFASINYRLNGFDSHPQQIHDVKGAIRWLRANAKKYGYDASRIAIGGGSAGAHLALLLGLSAGDTYLEGTVGGNLKESTRVQAIIDLYGPTDLNKFAEYNKRFRRQTTAKLLQSASPIDYLSHDDPPIIILHGSMDKLVPQSLSELLNKSYQQAGLDSYLHIVEGGGHGGKQFSDNVRQKVIKDFLDAHLMLPKNTNAAKPTLVTAESKVDLADAKKFESKGEAVLNKANLYGFHWMVGPRAGLAGTEKKFKKLLATIDHTLTTNDLISGVYIISHWDLIEEQQGKYNFERLDRIIKRVRQHGRYYKLAIAPGIYSPDWLYSSGAEAFDTVGSNPNRVGIYNKPVRIPVPWDPVFQSSYFSMMKKISERYGSDTHFRAVTLTVATFMSPEWYLPHSDSDRKKWETMGNYVEKLQKTWIDGIDRFGSLFPSQTLIVEASSYPVRQKAMGDAIIDYGVKNFKGRFAVQINQLTGIRDQISSPTFVKLIDYRKKYGSDISIGLQNVKGWGFPGISKKQGSKAMTAYNFLQAKGDYWELWYGDGKNVQTTQELQNFVLQGQALGLEKNKEKMLLEGTYMPPIRRKRRDL